MLLIRAVTSESLEQALAQSRSSQISTTHWNFPFNIFDYFEDRAKLQLPRPWKNLFIAFDEDKPKTTALVRRRKLSELQYLLFKGRKWCHLSNRYITLTKILLLCHIVLFANSTDYCNSNQTIFLMKLSSKNTLSAQSCPDSSGTSAIYWAQFFLWIICHGCSAMFRKQPSYCPCNPCRHPQPHGSNGLFLIVLWPMFAIQNSFISA